MSEVRPDTKKRTKPHKYLKLERERETWENNGVFHTDSYAYKREHLHYVYIYAILVREFELSRKKRF